MCILPTAMALAAARPAQAQSAADTAALASAVASVVVDTMLSNGRLGSSVVWDQWIGAFDFAVARRLSEHPSLRGPVSGRPQTPRIHVRSMQIVGDSAEVVVETYEDFGGSEEITAETERYPFVFVRTPGGWKFVRSELRIRYFHGWVRG